MSNWMPDPHNGEPRGNAYDPGFGQQPAPHPAAQRPLMNSQIPPGSPVPVSPQEAASERGMASFAHWGAIFLSWAAGLIALLAKPTQGGRYQEIHAKESLNFSIVMVIGYMISGVLMTVYLGFLLWIGVWVFDIVQRVKAAQAADQGLMPNYWLPFRVLN